MFHNFVPTEPKRKRSDGESSSSSSVSAGESKDENGNVVSSSQSNADKIKSLKKTRRKEQRIMLELFDSLNDTYTDLCKKSQEVFTAFRMQLKGKYNNDRDALTAHMQRRTQKRRAAGEPTGFEKQFLASFNVLNELSGPEGITYREAYRGPVKRSWAVHGMKSPTLEKLRAWAHEPIYIMWEKRQERQLQNDDPSAGPRNYNDYEIEGGPHLTWELPSARTDVLSRLECQQALFPQKRLVIVIEKFKAQNPAVSTRVREEIVTQHRIKGIYIVVRKPKSGDVKLCLIESQYFLERYCEGLPVTNIWFFNQPTM